MDTLTDAKDDFDIEAALEAIEESKDK